MIQTEFSFTLPHGYVDGDGEVHRDGVMRMATAMDEIAPLKELARAEQSGLSDSDLAVHE